MYENGLPNARISVLIKAGPNAVVNGTTCKGLTVAEIPMDVLAAQQPRALYILLGTNVLNRDGDYSSFLTYYRLMLDMISQSLPNTTLYVQSITLSGPKCGKSTLACTRSGCARSTMSWRPSRWRRTASSSTRGRYWPMKTAT